MKNVIRKHKFWLLLVFLSTAGIAVNELLKASLMQYILDSVNIRTMDRLKTACLFTIAYLIAMLVIFLFHDITTTHFIRVCTETIKNQWMSKIEKKELSEYDATNISNYISGFTVDIQSIEEEYLQNFLLVIRYFMTGISSVIAIYYVHYYYLIIIAAICWIPLLINHLWAKKITNSRLAASMGNAEFTRVLREALTGFELTKFYGLSEHMKNRFLKENHDLEKKRFDARWAKEASETTSSTASILLWFSTLLMGIYLAIRNLVTVGSIMKVNQLLNNVVNPLYRISLCTTKMKAGNTLYLHVSESMETRDSKSELEEKTLEKISEFQDKIELQSVGIRLGEQQVLKNTNVCFEKGKKYLLTGESGCGKSTLLKLLLGYYKDYQGSILVDGQNLSKVQMDSWYESVAVVSQKDFLLQDTVRNNLCLFRSIPEEEIENVLDLCCLRSFIKKHPAGLDFVIEEDGKNISGGEKQRICLARALLKKAPVLILDEALSALDEATAIRVEQNLLNLSGVTILAISHKLFEETIGQYDVRIQMKANGN